MRTTLLLLALAASLTHCVRSAPPPAAPLEDDQLIVFPQFFERPVVKVGEGSEPHELEGVVLRAVMIAAHDFLPLGNKERPCWGRQEAHRYRIILQEDIIFVRIDEELEFCGLQYVSMDSGARYAISVDGRILRRILDGEPEQPRGPSTPDAGAPEGSVESLTSPTVAP